MNLYKRVIEQQQLIYQCETLGFDSKLVNAVKTLGIIKKDSTHYILGHLQNKKITVKI